MKVNEALITSILDTDQYKINMGSVVFHLFPRSIVAYEFFNRGKTEFPEGFADELRHQLYLMSGLQLTSNEGKFLKSISYLRPTFIEWFGGYRLDPSEVMIKQTGGKLSIQVIGYWYRTIHWEVMLMAVISELYFKLTGQEMSADWQHKIVDKAKMLEENGCYWIDFGTRRRFSLAVQDEVVRVMANKNGFLGTSNPYLAFKYGLKAHGTYAHESVMAMSALYGVRMANKMWMKHWAEHFEGNVGVSITDTFTTGAFLQDFTSYEARLFDGVRHDSADPIRWGYDMLAHYNKLGISARDKRLVFSDGLNVPKYVEIHKHFQGKAQPSAGIGTNFTNDVGCKPLNIVIKMTSAEFGNGPVDVVKLSDDMGKHTGSPDAIELAKRSLNIK